MTHTVLLAVGLLRVALMAVLAIACGRLLWRLDHDRDPANRRRANPSLRHGLGLLGLSGAGLSMLNLRLVLIRILDDDRLLAVLLMRTPDMVGEVAAAAMMSLGIAGTLLMVRGARAMVFRGAPGDLRISRSTRVLLPLLVFGVMALLTR